MKTTTGRKRGLLEKLSRILEAPMLLAAIMLAVLIQPVAAGDPEYLQLNLAAGQALEIEGTWNSAGYFVANDIETLPQARRPKLRGEIQKISSKIRAFVMYGIPITVDEEAEFIESGENFTFDSLKAGMRIEVTCKIGPDGIWQARKIKARDVKPTDKIKGTISRVAVDGKPPDTIEITTDRTLDIIPASVKVSGIIILLLQETDVKDAMLFEQWVGEEEFGDLNASSAAEMTGGKALNEKFFVTGEYRNNIRSQREFDLSTRSQVDRDESEQDIRGEVYGFFAKDMRAFGELRMKKTFLIASQQNGLGSGPYKMDLIQLYFLASNIGGKKVALQIGRQDYDEPREWLFDDYLDAIKLSYYGLNSVLFEGAFIYGGESYKPQIRTWTDFYGSVRYYFDRTNFVAAYVMTRSDTDVRKMEPNWMGLRYYGQIKEVLRPWAELAKIGGKDKNVPLDGWAIDLGATVIAENTYLKPSVTFGYAVASGDSTKTDQTDHRFRQTGYEDNVDVLGGVTSLSYYGAVLDPELSNLKITTFGVGVQPTSKSSVELIYHKYSQDYADNAIKGSNLVPVPFGISNDIGTGVDIVIGFPKLLEHIKSRWVLGWFTPGEAFQPLYMEVAFLSRIDIKVGF